LSTTSVAFLALEAIIWHETMIKVVAKNRRARYDYEIVDTVEAGIILTGQEVKSCRLGNINLSGAYVTFFEGESPVLKNTTIAKYVYASNVTDYDPNRDRQLLLHKAEFAKLRGALTEKGVSLIPLEVKAGRHIKIVLGLGKGRKRLDKRHRIKEREQERSLKKGEEY